MSVASEDLIVEVSVELDSRELLVNGRAFNAGEKTTQSKLNSERIRSFKRVSDIEAYSIAIRIDSSVGTACLPRNWIFRFREETFEPILFSGKLIQTGKAHLEFRLVEPSDIHEVKSCYGIC